MALCPPAAFIYTDFIRQLLSRILFSSFAVNTGDRAKSRRAGGPSLLFAGLELALQDWGRRGAVLLGFSGGCQNSRCRLRIARATVPSPISVSPSGAATPRQCPRATRIRRPNARAASRARCGLYPTPKILADAVGLRRRGALRRTNRIGRRHGREPVTSRKAWQHRPGFRVMELREVSDCQLLAKVWRVP